MRVPLPAQILLSSILISTSGLLCTPSFALTPQDATDGGVTYANTTSTAIVDASTVTSTIHVEGALPTIFDLSLQTFILHSNCADLDITLESPAGTIVTITTDNGGSLSNVFLGTIFDDDASAAVSDVSYQNNTPQAELVPEGALSAFQGENPNGEWTLSVGDDNAGATGSFTWALLIASTPNEPQTVLTTATEVNAIAIPDQVTLDAVLEISGAEGFLFDLELDVDITHTWPADLEITLISPQGTQVTVTTDNGAGNDNVFNGTSFRDNAPIPVTDAVYANLVAQPLLSPEAAFGAFMGEDPNGTWTLHIVDDQLQDSGSLNSWTLRINSTLQNVVPGRSTGPLISNAKFAIDRKLIVDGGGGIGLGNDSFDIKGTMPVAGAISDLNEVAVTLSANGLPLAPTALLDAKGKHSSVSKSGGKLQWSLSPKNGAFSAKVSGIALTALLGLSNTTEEGEVAVELEVCFVRAGLIFARGTSEVVFDYKTTEDKSSKGKYSFKSNATRTQIFMATKTQAKEVAVEGSVHTFKVQGSIADSSGEPLIPTGDIELQMGAATTITIPFSALVITGKGVDTETTLTAGAVPELVSFTISNKKKSFAFATNAVGGTGLPGSSEEAPLSHLLDIRLRVTTAVETAEFGTTVELLRKSGTTTSWSR